MGKRKSFLVILVCIYFQILALISRVQTYEATYPRSQESDRITHLPGQPSNPKISHFSGFVTVNEEHGRALFYWFFEAQSDPSTKPLLLWLNGGPGCSSIGYGAAVELGPFRVLKNGNLSFNEFAWNKGLCSLSLSLSLSHLKLLTAEANLLFLESPVGVGFSYTNTSSDLDILDDSFVAEDAYNFLLSWLQKFPQFQTRPFFISGESYAGHYVPQLAELISDRNKERSQFPFINLKGFILGNPITNDYLDIKGLVEYAWSHAVISDLVYRNIKLVCDFSSSNWSSDCNKAMALLFNLYSEIDIYNIYAPTCVTNTTHSSSLNKDMSDIGSMSIRLFGGYDPCYSKYTEEYFNRIDVREAMHANIGGVISSNQKWQTCNNSLLRKYIYNVFSVLPVYTKLVQGGVKIWIYSGDADGRVPVIGSRYCIDSLGLPLISQWRSWFHDHQVGGRIVEYEGLTFVTVRGAGHLVPLNKPSEALSLIHSFLTGSPLPSTRS